MFISVLNTVIEDEIVNIIQYPGDKPDGVKVLTQIPGVKERFLKDIFWRGKPKRPTLGRNQRMTIMEGVLYLFGNPCME